MAGAPALAAQPTPFKPRASAYSRLSAAMSGQAGDTLMKKIQIWSSLSGIAVGGIAWGALGALAGAILLPVATTIATVVLGLVALGIARLFR